MGLIKGQTITLYSKTQTGSDPFGQPVYEETPVEVSNVLIAPISADAAPEQDGLQNALEAYEIHIPKGDTNIWEDSRISFWGKVFRSVGAVKRYMDENTPLDWIGSIRVEHYDRTDRA